MSSIIQKYKKLRSELDSSKKELKLVLSLLQTEVDKRKLWKTNLSELLTLEYNTGNQYEININILKNLIVTSTAEIKFYFNNCYKLKRRIKVISSQMSNLIK